MVKEFSSALDNIFTTDKTLTVAKGNQISFNLQVSKFMLDIYILLDHIHATK
jgi:hypothetical protein